MGMSLFLEMNILDAYYGGDTIYTPPSDLYLAFFSSPPTQGDDTAIEISGGSYARCPITNDSTNFGPATQMGAQPTKKTNLTSFIFPTATGSWTGITGFGVYDAPTGGNLIHWGPTVPFSVTSGQTYFVAPGKLIITQI